TTFRLRAADPQALSTRSPAAGLRSALGTPQPALVRARRYHLRLLALARNLVRNAGQPHAAKRPRSAARHAPRAGSAERPQRRGAGDPAARGGGRALEVVRGGARG